MSGTDFIREQYANHLKELKQSNETLYKAGKLLIDGSDVLSVPIAAGTVGLTRLRQLRAATPAVTPSPIIRPSSQIIRPSSQIITPKRSPILDSTGLPASRSLVTVDGKPLVTVPRSVPDYSSRIRRRLFATTSETGTTTLEAGAGETDKWGNVWYSTLGSADDVALARYHESVHSFLSPKFKLFRELRADVRMAGYQKSSTLRYIEEALAESYAQLRVNGIRGLPAGIKFPIIEKYVTIRALAAEGGVGTIVIGGVTYYVFYLSE